jgi:hypothetical protein
MAATSEGLSKIDSLKAGHQTILRISSGARTSTVLMTLCRIVAFGVIEDAQVVRTAREVTRGRGHGDKVELSDLLTGDEAGLERCSR